jgi:hypothetical protein
MFKMKKCTKCLEIKEDNCFFKNQKSKDGLRTECKQCHDEIKKVWEAKNKENILKKRKEYRSRRDVKDRRCVIAKEWNKKNNASVICTRAKKRAKQLNLPFDITKEDIIIPEFCPILGIKMEYSDGYMADNSPSIDRIVPELGYVKNNIIIISNRANRIKNNASLEEIQKLYNWLKNTLNKTE